jgi:hypothetical protein
MNEEKVANKILDEWQKPGLRSNEIFWYKLYFYDSAKHFLTSNVTGKLIGMRLLYKMMNVIIVKKKLCGSRS